MIKRVCTRALPSLFALGIAACGSSESGTADAGGQGIPDASTVVFDAASVVDASLTDAASFDAAGLDADVTDLDAGPPVTGVVLNEVLLDQAGNDGDEFAELKGEPNTDYSNLSLLQIDGDNGDMLDPGLVLTVHAGCTTDANGYCEIEVNANQFQNGTQTLLLVTGAANFMGQDIDADDDGTIDNEPWDQLVDAVAIFDGVPAMDNTDRTYAGNSVLNKTLDNGQPTAFGGASRIPDGTDTDAAADWTSNTPNFDNSGIATGEARNTPGAVNTVEP